MLGRRPPQTNMGVYNLCIEAGYGYTQEQMKGPILRLQLYDGQAPPLHLVHAFCQDALEWLRIHADHVVIVHCKAGKGRTGALVRLGQLPQSLTDSLTLAIWVRPPMAVHPIVAALVHVYKGKAMSLLSPSQSSILTYSLEADSAWHAAPEDSNSESVAGDGRSTTEGKISSVQQVSLDPTANQTGEGPLVINFGSTQDDLTKDVSSSSSSGLLAWGDIKVQVFRGKKCSTSSAIFTGGGSLYSTWVSTAFSPGASCGGSKDGKGTICMQQRELDKVAKRLKKPHRGLTLEVEYLM
eukprot:gene14993-21051_t